jgi:hypothetical protein
MNKIIILLLLILATIGITIFLMPSSILMEGFSLDQSSGDYPAAQTDILVQSTYPPIGKNELSNNTSNDIWMNYPTFQLGSYEQLTNNIRYPDSPDEGTCMPASMCGALYKDKKTGHNVITPLPPVGPNCGTRIGYFTTDEQLTSSLPFRSDLSNILY